MKAQLIKAIEDKIDQCNELDGESILWWNKFKDFVQDFKPEKKTVEQRAIDFYNELILYLDQYPAPMLREFYDYWTEKSKNGRKMRFEMEKTWDLSRRLQRWKRTSKPSKNGKETRIDKFTKGYTDLFGSETNEPESNIG